MRQTKLTQYKAPDSAIGRENFSHYHTVQDFVKIAMFYENCLLLAFNEC